MLSKNQKTIIENMKSNHDVLLSSDAEIKDAISKHKDEKYFPSDIILRWKANGDKGQKLLEKIKKDTLI